MIMERPENQNRPFTVFGKRMGGIRRSSSEEKRAWYSSGVKMIQEDKTTS